MFKLNSDVNGNELLSKDANGIVWVKNIDNVILGIVDSTEILDAEGIRYEHDALRVLKEHGFDLNIDWEDELHYLDFIECNGEVSRVIITSESATIAA